MPIFSRMLIFSGVLFTHVYEHDPFLLAMLILFEFSFFWLIIYWIYIANTHISICPEISFWNQFNFYTWNKNKANKLQTNSLRPNMVPKYILCLKALKSIWNFNYSLNKCQFTAIANWLRYNNPKIELQWKQG